MDLLTGALASQGIEVERFNFQYMRESLERGKPKPPSRLPVLIEEFAQQIRAYGSAEKLFIGGKSLGGRVASHLVETEPVKGLIVFGYPFHPPGKPESLRTEHLYRLTRPTLICQGERDPFGTRSEVESYNLDSLEFFWAKDGDHQFRPRRRSGASMESNLQEVAARTACFMRAHS